MGIAVGTPQWACCEKGRKERTLLGRRRRTWWMRLCESVERPRLRGKCALEVQQGRGCRRRDTRTARGGIARATGMRARAGRCKSLADSVSCHWAALEMERTASVRSDQPAAVGGSGQEFYDAFFRSKWHLDVRSCGIVVNRSRLL